MFFVLSKTLDLLVAPITWVIVLALLGVPFRRKARQLPRWRRLAPLAAVVVLVLFSNEVVSNALVRSLEAPPLQSYRPEITYDTVVLLGGLVDERASQTYGVSAYNDSVERLTVTFDLLRQDHAKTAIVSGGSDASISVVEAVALRNQLVAWGIADDRVIVEDKARNTRDNAVESARIIHERGFTTVLIVTSAFHMGRARGCFRAVGIDADTLPVDFRGHESSSSLVPRAQYLENSTIALREWTGRAVYRVRGYSKP